MKSPYDSRTEETRDRIMGDRRSYIPNRYYKSAEGGFWFYINTKGYYHIIKPCRVKYDGVFDHYEIVDYLLTKENTLKEISSRGYYKDREEVIKTISKNVAE